MEFVKYCCLVDLVNAGFLLIFFIYSFFVSSSMQKMDKGPCPKVHSLLLRKEYPFSGGDVEISVIFMLCSIMFGVCRNYE